VAPELPAAVALAAGPVCGNAKGVMAMFGGRLCCINCTQKSSKNKDSDQQGKKIRQTHIFILDVLQKEHWFYSTIYSISLSTNDQHQTKLINT